MKKAIILFIKAPELGKVKSRLAKNIGNLNATELYKCFVKDILKDLKHKLFDIDLRVYYSPSNKISLIRNEFKNNYYLPQIDGNLGHKMKVAFIETFEQKYQKAIIIGSDTLDISEDIINNSFEQLNSFGSIIGETKDGGYYLLGFNKNSFNQKVFDNIIWSTNSVYQKTIENLEREKITFSKLPIRNDIDNIEDLYEYYKSKYISKSEVSLTIEKIISLNLFDG